VQHVAVARVPGVDGPPQVECRAPGVVLEVQLGEVAVREQRRVAAHRGHARQLDERALDIRASTALERALGSMLKLPHSGLPAFAHVVPITGPCGGFKRVDGNEAVLPHQVDHGDALAALVALPRSLVPHIAGVLAQLGAHGIPQGAAAHPMEHVGRGLPGAEHAV
jgi:hypothetical protein